MIKNRGNLICDDLNKPSSKNTKPSEFENEKIQIMDNYNKSNLEKFDDKNLKFSSKLKK